jgi:hypothetical protein
VPRIAHNASLSCHNARCAFRAALHRVSFLRFAARAYQHNKRQHRVGMAGGI